VRYKVQVFLVLSGLILIGYVVFILFKDTSDFSLAYQDRHQRLISKVPDSLEFAGEKVHFKTIDSYQHFYRELKLNTKNNSSTRLLMRDATIWLPQIEAVIKKYKLPKDIQYIAMAESRFQNDASQKGAVGFWQFKVATAQEMKLRVDEEVDQRLDPILSTHAACRFFRQNYKVFKSWTLVAAAYNRGSNGLLRDMKRQQARSYYDLTLNLETERYLYKVISMKDLYEHPEKYKLKRYTFRRPAFNYVTVDQSITDLAVFAQQQGITKEELNYMNPWLIGNSLTLQKPNEKYYVAIGVK
jgi:membrane-bound lytic murein transglycosylase D